MNAPDITSFKLGNLVELEPLCEMLDKDNVVLQVVERKKVTTVFLVTYLGVAIGTATYDAIGNWEWEELK